MNDFLPCACGSTVTGEYESCDGIYHIACVLCQRTVSELDRKKAVEA